MHLQVKPPSWFLYVQDENHCPNPTYRGKYSLLNPEACANGKLVSGIPINDFVKFHSGAPRTPPTALAALSVLSPHLRPKLRSSAHCEKRVFSHPRQSVEIIPRPQGKSRKYASVGDFPWDHLWFPKGLPTEGSMHCDVQMSFSVEMCLHHPFPLSFPSLISGHGDH